MSIETLTGLFDLLPTCSLKDEPEAMKKMPPLPDKLNEEMINSILHPPARPAPRQPWEYDHDVHLMDLPQYILLLCFC